MRNIYLFQAIATLVGTIIGAGILGIPYVFDKAGFWTGSLALLMVGLSMILMQMMYGEVTLRTEGEHQVSGYIEIYLGRFMKYFSSVILVSSLYGALLAYTIGEGEVISALTGYSVFWCSIGFLILFSFFLYVGLKLIKWSELVMISIIFFIIIVIAILSLDYINLANLKGFDAKSLILPYGVLLFACSGTVAVPEVRRILYGRENMMKKAILWGALIPPIVYFIFTVLIVSISGGEVAQVATIGLGEILGTKMLLISNGFAFFAMATSFLTIGMALKEIYRFDFKLPHAAAWMLTSAIVFLAFLMGPTSFVNVLNIVGAVGLGIVGIINVLTYFRARKYGSRLPEYVIPRIAGSVGGAVLIVVFITGIVYTIMNL